MVVFFKNIFFSNPYKYLKYTYVIHTKKEKKKHNGLWQTPSYRRTIAKVGQNQADKDDTARQEAILEVISRFELAKALKQTSSSSSSTK